jgi:hypothetical protein
MVQSYDGNWLQERICVSSARQLHHGCLSGVNSNVGCSSILDVSALYFLRLPGLRPAAHVTTFLLGLGDLILPSE